MKLKTFRTIGIVVMLLCAFKLGSIHQETQHFKRIVECVKAPNNVGLQEFYGHDFKDLTHTLWNHASGHNAHVYLKCIYRDL